MDFLTTTATTVLPEGIALAGLAAFQSQWLWALIVAFHLAFVFAFAMGASEVSNAFATSVASGAISLRAAYVLATFVESAGGILLGYKVLETLRFGVIDLPMYEHSPRELLVGQVAILTGCAIWMLFANMCRLPVSSTHSHIGSIIGFSMVMRGPKGLHIGNVIEIIISWIVSPALSGLISVVIYIIFDFAVLRRENPLVCGFRAMPFFYFFVFAFNTFVVTYHGSKWIGFDKTPFWKAILMALGVGTLAAIIFQLIVRPYLQKWVRKQETSSSTGSTTDVLTATVVRVNDFDAETGAGKKSDNGVVRVETALVSANSKSGSLGAISKRGEKLQQQEFSMKPSKFFHWLLPNRKRTDDPQTLRLFSAIQVFTGCFTGFSHGSKDIPNTIAPLATLLYVFNSGQIPHPQETPLWVLAYGSLGTCVGFWMLGHRVIRTVGHEFTDINPYCGFTIELGAAITVLIAAKLGIPVSMTLCIVGSIVAVGAVRGSVPVNWALFRNVFLAWVCTFPLSGVFAAGTMFVLRWLFL